MAFSEIAANPTGVDAANLDEEVVVLEVADPDPQLEVADPDPQRPADDETKYRLQGFELAYGGRRYAFPDILDAVPPGSDIDVHTGEGDDAVNASAPPEYVLHVGSAEPLLANDGQRLALRDGDGDVVDEVSYPQLQPGQRWVRPE